VTHRLDIKKELAHTFRPFLYVVTKSECKEAIGYAMTCLKQAAHDLFNIDLAPRVVIGDCSDQLMAAVRKVFTEDVTQLNCWGHLKRKGVTEKVKEHRVKAGNVV